MRGVFISPSSLHSVISRSYLHYWLNTSCMDQYEDNWPTSPYSPAEQMQIMRDLEESKKQAFMDKDEERLRNLKEIVCR